MQFAERQFSVGNRAVPEENDCWGFFFFFPSNSSLRPRGLEMRVLCLPATCTRKSNVNAKSNWKLHLAQELLPGTHGSVQRGD